MNIDPFFLESASTLAPQIDMAMLSLLLICGAVFCLVFLLMLFFGIRYRKNSTHNRQLKKQESLLLEWGWTIGSLVIFLGFFVFGAVIFFEMHVADAKALEITVVGKQWMWKFQHSNGKREINELHIPIGQPIVLKMISEDVIHSLFVPSFRLKQDVIPGRYTRTWVEASKVGDYHLFCTQYCGTMHAQMIGRVFVLSVKDFENWLASDTGKLEPSEPETMMSRGEKVFKKFACISCHTGKIEIGPSLTNLYGSKVKLTTGKTIIADDDYIRESILYPNEKVVYGYPPIMPSFLGRISEEELLDLVAYIKSLGNKNSSITSRRKGEIK